MECFRRGSSAARSSRAAPTRPVKTCIDGPRLVLRSHSGTRFILGHPISGGTVSKNYVTASVNQCRNTNSSSARRFQLTFNLRNPMAQNEKRLKRIPRNWSEIVAGKSVTIVVLGKHGNVPICCSPASNYCPPPFALSKTVPIPVFL